MPPVRHHRQLQGAMSWRFSIAPEQYAALRQPQMYAGVERWH